MIRNNINRLFEHIENIKAKNNINYDISIVAATKTVDTDRIKEAINSGIKIIGENRAQELKDKYDDIKDLCDIHFIGHLQTNKIKIVSPRVSMIQSIDSIKLASRLSEYLIKNNYNSMDVLIEVNVSGEGTKAGFLPEEIDDIIDTIYGTEKIKLCGFMTIGPLTEDRSAIAKGFSKMYSIFERYKDKYNLTILSMGMSDDYDIAISEGSNMIRVGSAIFGKRRY